MSHLIAVMFDTREEAQGVRMEFGRMSREHLVDLEDSVVVYRDEKGRVKLDQSVRLTGPAAASGMFWGLLIGLLLSIPFGGPFLPLITGAFGAGFGALSGKLHDYGIDDDMMKQVGREIEQGRAVLFVLVRDATMDRVLDELAPYEGRVLKTSFPRELEEELHRALETTERRVAAGRPGEAAAES